MLKSLFSAKAAPAKKSGTPNWYASMQSYVQQPNAAVWSKRDYSRFAKEAYQQNVIAHRAISMISKGAASVALCVKQGDARTVDASHPLCALLNAPSPLKAYASFFQELYSHLLISGNAYVQVVGVAGDAPRELHLLRPDRVKIIAGNGALPAAYHYIIENKTYQFPIDQVSGASRILHIKEFNPTDDWYGLSPVEAAAYSIDQHNQAGEWNQSLLQNGARPSGALVVKSHEGGTGHLSEEQYYRVKGQIDEQFSGAGNAGRPLLLEGGLEWKEMSLSPKDMDFIECKNSAARDIALAFGVPPQLLGIPGDNTYSNLAEARLAMWEQTIIPLVTSTSSSLQSWLAPMFDSTLYISANLEHVSALALKRDALWQRASNASFLTDDEKRELVGLPPHNIGA